ncbi:hypothetical protein [Frankia sp. Cas4]|uniref:hypothetical protein n=1 Tax=Frankia sp. Cas4 TaxID=3073927 RepID=UPI002AD42BC0|nr:hypothetical protein [Frankia sp. Cas4]
MTTMLSERTGALPGHDEVGHDGAEILSLVVDHPDFERFRLSTLAYPDCWATFTGYPLVAGWDLDQDGPALFDEALRVMCLKAAVFRLTDGDEWAAELMCSPPVDEMIHALIAQFTLLVRIQQSLGIVFVHSTDMERFGWNPGDYTHRCYRVAGWGDLNPRYWIGASEVARRLAVLREKYDEIGIHDDGRRHDFDFGQVI